MALTSLLTRSFLGKRQDNEHTCRNYEEDNRADPLTGDLTLHELFTYISAASMAVCCICTFGIMIGHILNYHRPRIQKQLIRMVFMMPVFAIFCFVGIMSYRAAPYLLIMMDFYEVFAMIAAFYFILALLTPNARTWHDQVYFFSKPENGGKRSFTRTYIMVMQLLPGRVVTTIAGLALTAIDCYGSENYTRGRLAITVINAIQLVITIIAMIRFIRRWFTQLTAADSKFVGKMACFKLIVVLEIIQQLIFRILDQTDVLHPTDTMSYNDVHVGLDATVVTGEVAILSIGMVWAYWPLQHRPQQQPHAYAIVEAGKPDEQSEAPPEKRLSPLRAVWDAIDLLDVIAGMGRMVTLPFRRGGNSRRRSPVAQPLVR